MGSPRYGLHRRRSDEDAVTLGAVIHGPPVWRRQQERSTNGTLGDFRRLVTRNTGVKTIVGTGIKSMRLLPKPVFRF